jgi:NTP pyrophosphatase (non-canonical NTP hydrolase)
MNKLIHISDLTFSAINAEFISAQVKHKGRTPMSPEMTDGERLAILVEEVGEVAKAMTHDGDRSGLVKELIQVCAMSAAWIEYQDGR